MKVNLDNKRLLKVSLSPRPPPPPPPPPSTPRPPPPSTPPPPPPHAVVHIVDVEVGLFATPNRTKTCQRQKNTPHPSKRSLLVLMPPQKYRLVDSSRQVLPMYYRHLVPSYLNYFIRLYSNGYQPW